MGKVVPIRRLKHRCNVECIIHGCSEADARGELIGEARRQLEHAVARGHLLVDGTSSTWPTGGLRFALWPLRAATGEWDATCRGCRRRFFAHGPTARCLAC